MTRENTVNVPVEPTEAMIEAAQVYCHANRPGRASDIYRAMLSAAPLHEGGWSELERLARAATPGPWMHEPDHYNDHGGRYDEICSPVETVSGEWGGPSGANAAFIAAANPATILKLIASARAAPPPSVEVFDSSPDGDTHRVAETAVVGWQTMESAPKDRPILGWCVHDADPYFIEPEDGSGRSRLTLYGGHAEGLSHVSDGPHVIEWGGSWDDRSHEYDGGWMPDWWFRSDSEFEVTANPVLWMDIEPPAASHSPGMETLQASECTKHGEAS